LKRISQNLQQECFPNSKSVNEKGSKIGTSTAAMRALSSSDGTDSPISATSTEYPSEEEVALDLKRIEQTIYPLGVSLALVKRYE
jgi:hypothetical protein